MPDKMPKEIEQLLKDRQESVATNKAYGEALTTPESMDMHMSGVMLKQKQGDSDSYDTYKSVPKHPLATLKDPKGVDKGEVGPGWNTLFNKHFKPRG